MARFEMSIAITSFLLAEAQSPAVLRLCILPDASAALKPDPALFRHTTTDWLAHLGRNLRCLETLIALVATRTPVGAQLASLTPPA